MRPIQIASLIVLPLAVGVLMAGCDNTPPSGSGPGTSESEESSVNHYSMTEILSSLPLSGYMRNAADIYVTGDSALREYVRECMSAAGFDYLEPPLSRTDTPDFRGYGNRYSAISHDQRMKSYSARGAQVSSDDDNSPIEADPPNRAYLLALYGTEEAASSPVLLPSGSDVGTFSEPGGCVATALTNLYGSVDRYREIFTIFRAADQFVADGVSAISAVAASSPESKAWSDCFYAATGMRWTDPFIGYETDWTSVSWGDEQAIFDGDVECKRSSGLAEVLVAADTASQAKALEANPTLPTDVENAFKELIVATEAAK